MEAHNNNTPSPSTTQHVPFLKGPSVEEQYDDIDIINSHIQKGCQLESFKALIDKVNDQNPTFLWGAEASIAYIHGNTIRKYPMALAAYYGRLDVIKYLHAITECDIYDDDVYALIVAGKHGHVDVVKYFVEERYTPIDEYRNQLIRSAIDERQIEVVKYILNLLKRTMEGDTKLMKELIKRQDEHTSYTSTESTLPEKEEDKDRDIRNFARNQLMWYVDVIMDYKGDKEYDEIVNYVMTNYCYVIEKSWEGVEV